MAIAAGPLLCLLNLRHVCWRAWGLWPCWGVFNDDVVAPHTGFGTHPHQEMEIMTIVLDGEVTHEDSLGTKAVLQAGDVQRMSVGTGIRHSEFNLGEVPAYFYQIWICPDTSSLPPSYDQKSFAGADQCPLCRGWGYVQATLRGARR
jgi:redox-sensitive bicupin YhaK (pirin superfamily)